MTALEDLAELRGLSESRTDDERFDRIEAALRIAEKFNAA